MSDPVFFEPSRRFTAAEVAEITGAALRDAADAGVEISAIASLAEAVPGALVFLASKKGASALPGLRAAAILCAAPFADQVPPGIAVLVTSSPQRAFATIGRLLYPAAAAPVALTGETGISPRAFVDATASLEAGVIVEAGAVIGPGAAIGAGTIVAPNAVVGRNCRIGRNCHVGPGAVVQYALIGNGVVIHAGAKIGQDGFGFAVGKSGPERVPQIGRVVIQDNVEVGANTTIDRGALGDTVIGENTKIDNQVQIAHNVRIGRNCVIAGRTGISGSVTVGDGAMMGGGVGLADHLSIGAGAQLAAGSGFMHDVPAGEIWAGFPAKPIGTFMREVAAVGRMVRRKPKREGDDG